MRRWPRTQVRIRITQTYEPPQVEITLPSRDTFYFEEGDPIYVQASFKEGDFSAASNVKWFYQDQQLTTSQDGEEVSFEAQPHFSGEIKACVTDSEGFTGCDSFTVEVVEELLSVSFGNYNNSETGVYLVSAPGSKDVEPIKVFTNNGPYATATFSPDGRKVAYTKNSSCNDGKSVYVTNYDFSDPQEIGCGEYLNATVAKWFPDGQRLAFSGS